MRLLLAVLLSVTVTLAALKPSCFNCHCSALALDNNLRCNEAILNKSTTYFTLRTVNVTALYGSDIMLAVVMKERAEHCWCTDSHLEWNLQNVELWNDTQLITVTLQNVSAVATGHYWAVLEHNKLYYFSDPIYLNATGRIVPVPSPNLEADPKMSALVVGLLVVVILVLGLFIYCWKMVRRKRQERKLAVYKNMEQVQQFPVDEYYSELQQMSSIIDHMTELSKEEGAAEEAEDNTESSAVESSRQTATVAPVPTISQTRSVPEYIAPIVQSRSVPEYYEMPQITDDRFSKDNQRSWYKSLDVEINSQSLLKDPERAERDAEKKRQKEERKQSMSNISSGLLGSGMVCSGVMGNSGVSHTAQALALEDMRKYLDTITSMKECGYGRSLPTPMAAGRRPTVMTLFGNTSPGNTISKTATIHTTQPVARLRAQTLFQGMEERGSRVTFDDKVHSSDNMLIEKKKKKRKNSTKTPRKSSLKPKPEKSDDVPEKKSDDSTSSSSDDAQLEVPQLQLTPCSPPSSPNANSPATANNSNNSTPTNNPSPAPVKSSGSRFTVVNVAAEPESSQSNGDTQVNGS